MAAAYTLGRRRPALDWWTAISTGLLLFVWLVFLWAHLHAWFVTGKPVGIGVIVEESIVSVLFLIRRRPRSTSRSRTAWLAAIVGTFGTLAVRPAYNPVAGLDLVYVGLQLAGGLAAATSLWSLGRSFGMVAANRGVQTSGPYGWVRHPIYASYVISTLGYLLQNPSLLNAAVLALVGAAQLKRIEEEEKCLQADPAYVAYRHRVRYRLLPFVY